MRRLLDRDELLAGKTSKVDGDKEIGRLISENESLKIESVVSNLTKDRADKELNVLLAEVRALEAQWREKSQVVNSIDEKARAKAAEGKRLADQNVSLA